MSAWTKAWVGVNVAAVLLAAALLAAGGCGGPSPAAEPNLVQPVAPPEAPVEPAPAMPALPQGVDVPAQGTVPAAPVPEAPTAEPKAAEVVPQPLTEKKKTSTPATTKVEPVKPVPVTPIAKGEPAPTPKTEPAPLPKTEPAPAAKTHVTVPRTAHVRVEIPAGMQALLDDDPRMQPWVDKAMAIIERCYVSKGGGTSATMAGVVTMHKDARPDVDVTSLPPTLAGVVACATGDLMRNRMPLFSGPEGQRHTLKVRFSP